MSLSISKSSGFITSYFRWKISINYRYGIFFLQFCLSFKTSALEKAIKAVPFSSFSNGVHFGKTNKGFFFYVLQLLTLHLNIELFFYSFKSIYTSSHNNFFAGTPIIAFYPSPTSINIFKHLNLIDNGNINFKVKIQHLNCWANMSCSSFKICSSPVINETSIFDSFKSS